MRSIRNGAAPVDVTLQLLERGMSPEAVGGLVKQIMAQVRERRIAGIRRQREALEGKTKE